MSARPLARRADDLTKDASWVGAEGFIGAGKEGLHHGDRTTSPGTPAELAFDPGIEKHAGGAHGR